MRSVFMYVNSLYLLTIDISSDMGPFINDQTPLTPFRGEMGKRRSEQSGSYYEIVILLLSHILLNFNRFTIPFTTFRRS